jgi:hypothetical protein
MTDDLKRAKTEFITHAETSSVSMAPDTVLKQGAVSVQGGVLTVKNQELAELIQSKLAAASKLSADRLKAADADVSVGVKVHF